MKPIDYIIIGVVVIALAVVIIRLIQKKKKGESGCGCGCQNCPSAGACGAKKQEPAQENTKEEDENA